MLTSISATKLHTISLKIVHPALLIPPSPGRHLPYSHWSDSEKGLLSLADQFKNTEKYA